MARLVAGVTLLPIAARAHLYGRLLWSLVRDERVPLTRKGLLAAAAGYLIIGSDLIGDDIPVLGAVDDVVAVVLAVDLFLDGVPRSVLDEHLAGLGLDRRTFEADVAQVRRLVPGPLRRLVRLAPRLAGRLGRLAGSATLALRGRMAPADG